MANRTFSSSFVIAVLLHISLFGLLIFSWRFHSPPPALTPGPAIIHATAILPTSTPVSAPISPSTPPPIKSPPAPEKPVIKDNRAAVAIQKRKELEAKKIAEKNRQLELEKQQKKKNLQKLQQEKALQQQLTHEQQQLAAQRAQVMQGVVDKYKAQILQAIGQNWIIPANVDSTLSADLLIRLAPDGTVIEVKVTRSSGNALLDQSALVAVQKSSPLPVPDEPEAFKIFRAINLTVKPQGTLTSQG